MATYQLSRSTKLCVDRREMLTIIICNACKCLKGTFFPADGTLVYRAQRRRNHVGDVTSSLMYVLTM